jgi:hypothetical protein
VGHAVAFRGTERNALFGDDLLNDGKELLLAGAGFLGFAQLFQIQAVDQFLVNGGLQLLLFLFAKRPCIRGAAAQGRRREDCRCRAGKRY